MSRPNPQEWADDDVARHKKKGMSPLAMIGCGCLVLVLLVGGGCAALVWFGLDMMKDSEPYQHALERARSSPAVRAAIGEPIEDGFPSQANFHQGTDRSTASFRFPITGPDGEAEVAVDAVREDGPWRYDVLEARIEGGAVIDLRDGDF